MDNDIVHGPSNAAARVTLAAGETCVAEGGAMIAASHDIGIETVTRSRGKGGLLSGLKRMISGESFFLNHFKAGANGGEVWLGPALSGDIMAYELDNESLIVQSGSYLACEDDIEVGLGWQGFKSILSGESVFWVNLKGKGKAIVSSFGAIYPIEVDGEHIVDSSWTNFVDSP